jgi:protein CWC15
LEDEDGDDVENLEASRRRILEESRDIDADSDRGSEEDSSEDDSDEEDETAELQRELEKIKRERAEKREQEVTKVSMV